MKLKSQCVYMATEILSFWQQGGGHRLFLLSHRLLRSACDTGQENVNIKASAKAWSAVCFSSHTPSLNDFLWFALKDNQTATAVVGISSTLFRSSKSLKHDLNIRPVSECSLLFPAAVSITEQRGGMNNYITIYANKAVTEKLPSHIPHARPNLTKYQDD